MGKYDLPSNGATGVVGGVGIKTALTLGHKKRMLEAIASQDFRKFFAILDELLVFENDKKLLDCSWTDLELILFLILKESGIDSYLTKHTCDACGAEEGYELMFSGSNASLTADVLDDLPKGEDAEFTIPGHGTLEFKVPSAREVLDVITPLMQKMFAAGNSASNAKEFLEITMNLYYICLKDRDGKTAPAEVVDAISLSDSRRIKPFVDRVTVSNSPYMVFERSCVRCGSMNRIRFHFTLLEFIEAISI